MALEDAVATQSVSMAGQAGANGDVSRDLHILMAMVSRLRALTSSAEAPASPGAAYQCSGNGRRGRLLVFNREALLHDGPLTCVGFVSQLRRQMDPGYAEELEHTDAHMIQQLGEQRGLLCYFSRELLPGQWYNLVLFSHADAKLQLRDLATHRRAAYSIAPRAYAWIRLHFGTLASGMHSTRFELQLTRYYDYEAGDVNARVVNYA
jgi:muconolactone delta-isomerase